MPRRAPILLALLLTAVACQDDNPAGPAPDARLQPPGLLASALETPGDSLEVIVTTEGNMECRMTTFEGGRDFTYISPGLVPDLHADFVKGWVITEYAAGNPPSVPTLAFWVDCNAEVTFQEPVASAGFYYSSQVALTLQAFDENGRMVASTVGPANCPSGDFDIWDLVTVTTEENLISRLRINGAPSYAAIDNFKACRFVFTPPPDITVECNTAGGCGAVDLGAPTVPGDYGPDPLVTNDAPDFFPLGETLVTWTAVDTAGSTRTGTQTVTVVDTTPPSITAALTPRGRVKDDEGRFEFVFGATDVCDPDVMVTAALNGIPISSGDWVWMKVADDVARKPRGRWLYLEAPSFELVVTAVDASGNTATVTVTPPFPDDHGKARGNGKGGG